MFRFAVLAALTTLIAVAPLTAEGTQQPKATDIHEQLLLLAVTVDNHGKTLTVSIPVTVFTPDGSGAFPLVVISHGRAGSLTERKVPAVQRLESASRFFVRKGFAVAVPTRIGYGETADRGDPEEQGSSGDVAEYRDAVTAGATEVLQVASQLQKLPWVDPRRLVLIGQSVGGYVTTAAASENPPGLVAAINFAGGQGGDTQRHPGVPAAPETLETLYAEFGKTSRAPMLWVYTENDLNFGPTYSSRWHDAFIEAGGSADYRLLAPFKDNGHLLFAQGNDIWQPLVDDFLAPLGFANPGTIARPTPTPFAGLTEADKIPYQTAKTKESYAAFLASPLRPRAFAIAEDGSAGWAAGDDSLSRALANCRQHSAKPARLYAVDDDVVW